MYSKKNCSVQFTLCLRFLQYTVKSSLQYIVGTAYIIYTLYSLQYVQFTYVQFTYMLILCTVYRMNSVHYVQSIVCTVYRVSTFYDGGLNSIEDFIIFILWIVKSLVEKTVLSYIQWIVRTVEFRILPKHGNF